MLDLDSLLFIELNTCSFLHNDAFWRFFSSHYAWLIFVLPATFFLFYKWKRKGFLPLFFIFILFVVTDQGANLVKHSVQRPRPCQVDTLLEQMNFLAPHCGAYGFFSGHAANSMGLVLFCWLLFEPYLSMKKRSLILFFSFSVLVSISRIMVGVHYPGDILVGWLYGIITALILFWIYKKVLRYINSKYKIRNT